MKIWINSRFVEEKDARVSVFDRGFLYGDAVFETMRSYAGVVFRLDAHLGRLLSSLKVLKIKRPYDAAYLKDSIYKTLEVNRQKSAYVKLAITRGEGRFGIGYRDAFVPNIVIVAKDFEEYPDWMRKRGLSAGVVRMRQNEYSPLSGIKSANFLTYILARFHAKDDGFDEAILMNTRGGIAEAATSNIFLVKGNTVITPSLDSGILPGITRAVILKIAKKLRLGVKEKAVSYRELLCADEVFLTNSLAEVLPVTRIDSKRIGRGLPGELTKLLHISYQKQVIKEVLR